tara:strand:+ start:8470 stop:11559 length:3090 start_codon:yes stop_codon:yes gene_type:complete
MKIKAMVIAVSLALGVSTVATAQTSSSIRGLLTDPQGSPAENTTITITHVPSGSRSVATSNASGVFNAAGLRVGGPYTIEVNSNTYQNRVINDVYLNLDDPFSINLALEPRQTVESIVVTASALNNTSGAIGPSVQFNLRDLENAPVFDRSLNDIVRMDPRVYIDETYSDSIQCAGANPRFNSLTLDGVRLNDSFGLNSNGYPTERMPFSFDAIEQVAVQFAPFDAKFGGFTACNINAVTKSGENEIYGGVFYDVTTESLKGDSLYGVDIDNGDFEEKRYGFNVGVPVIEDTLFLFTAYEKFEGTSQFNYPALGSLISQDDVTKIREITKRVYGYDAGQLPASMPVEDEKLLLRADWNINDSHRASFVYNYNDGFNISQSDTFSQALTFDSTYYERGAELNSLSGALFSDWSQNFSTELRVGKTKLDNRQNSLDADSGFPEIQIRVGSGTAFIGPDDSRQSNKLNWESQTMKLAGTYYLGDHTITGGYEYEELDVFNLFVQHTVGEYRFNSIVDFEAGKVDRIYYGSGAGTNNPDDAAASFAYATNTLYLQDEFYATDSLTVLLGLRYDWYSSDDKPTLNSNFLGRYGYSNQSTMDGVDLLQPRLGFNWSASDVLDVRGGIGLYSGGNPNVWISNSYSNDGITNAQFNIRSVDLNTEPLSGNGRPLVDIPQRLRDSVTNSNGDSQVNAIDPNFEVPSEWKYALGASYRLGAGYNLTGDLIYTQKKDSAIVRDIGLRDSGKDAPDGRPIYETISGRSGDLILTNVSGDDGDSFALSLGVSKQFDNGFDVNFGYAYVRSTDVNPMTSSVAGSNYGNIAVSDPLNPGVETSNYEIPHRLTMNVAYETELFAGYSTRVNVFASANEGLPYNYTFSRSDAAFGDSSFFSNGRQLLYIPAVNDPSVVYGANFDVAAFNQFVQSENLEKYRGKIAPRNGQNADWWAKLDLRIEQEIPGFFGEDKASAFFVIKNLGNLLNDEWGVLRQGSFVGEAVVGMSLDANSKYVYESFSAPSMQTIQNGPSLWEARFGVKYNF